LQESFCKKITTALSAKDTRTKHNTFCDT